MKSSRLILITLSLLALSSCKTQEDIRREKTVENLNEEIQQTKKTALSGNSRFMSIEEQLSRLTGMVEESNHSKSQLNERINTLEEANKKQVEYLKALTEKVNNQSGYIEEVIETLSKLNAEKTSPKKKDEIVESSSEEATPITFKSGFEKFKKKEYNEAKEIFTQVSEDKTKSKKDREGSIHYLGMTELKLKNYEGAKVYFSKLFIQNPKSSFAPATLLNLGKTFNLLKSKDEANLTFEELISLFPKSKEAAEALKLKK